METINQSGSTVTLGIIIEKVLEVESIPRLAWGKYFIDGDKILLPFSVQAHHSFVDGIHMGQYIDYLQAYLDMFK